MTPYKTPDPKHVIESDQELLEVEHPPKITPDMSPQSGTLNLQQDHNHRPIGDNTQEAS